MTDKLYRKTIKILDVKINSSSVPRLLREVQMRLAKKRKFFIVTPNPEQITMAQKDPLYKEILNSANISLPDGIGLIAALKFFSLPRPKPFLKRVFVLFAQGLGVGFSILFDRDFLSGELKQIKGRDFFLELIKLANKRGWRVVLVGNERKSAQKAANALKRTYFKLNIVGLTGPNLDYNAKVVSEKDKQIEEEVIRKINRIKPDLLFIGFRASVQEKWLYRLFDRLEFLGAMVVGGTFDYISGVKPLPPKWIEDLNLEWLWRLIKRDQKFKRILRAFPEFALRIYLQKLVSKD